MSDTSEAARILRAGGLVAFPTETVYGLGADATNPAAVAKIFAAKGRPATNPLIVHVADAGTARRYVGAWPEKAALLAARFWPGPLTLVLPRSPQLAPAVSAGLATVGLRVPDHPVALELLQYFGGPVAAPSANRSNRVSPTTAQHVREELGDVVDVILDGGPCRVGIESTVLDLSGERPVILRPGGVPRGQVEAVVGPVDVATSVHDPAEPAKSPGRQETHYAPRAPAYRVPPLRWSDAVARMGHLPRGRHVLLALNLPDGESHEVTSIAMPQEPAEYARRLYAALRQADGLGADAILIELPPEEPQWEAVRDRISRATRPL